MRCRARAAARSPPGALGPIKALRRRVVPGLAAALMPGLGSHKVFSRRALSRLAFPLLAGEPQASPSFLEGFCSSSRRHPAAPRRVSHR